MSRKYFFILPILVFVACSKPTVTEEGARKCFIETKGFLEDILKHKMRITSFKKVNGQTSEDKGVKRYKFEYEAEIHRFWRDQYGSKDDKVKGTLVFEETENGWKGENCGVY